MQRHEFEQIEFVWGSGCIDTSFQSPEYDISADIMVVCGENTGSNKELMEPVRTALGSAYCCTYSGACQEITEQVITDGVAVAQAHDVDGLVSVGGGSSCDTAKAISYFHRMGGNGFVDSAIRRADNGVVRDTHSSESGLPIFAVPTTLSAAEISNSFSLDIKGENKQLVIVNEAVQPERCIYDSRLLATTPDTVVKRTSMTALNHGIEILCSDTRKTNPFYRATAEKSISLIATNIGAIESEQTRIKILTSLQLGAALSGLGLSGATGITAAINHALCVVAGIRHGDGYGVLIPHGIKFNQPVIPERIADVAAALGIQDFDADEPLSEQIELAIREIQAKLEIPQRLRDIGVKKSCFDEVAERALTDRALRSNPRAVTENDILGLLENAW